MKPNILTSLDLQDFRDAASQIPYQRIESGLFPKIELWIRRDDLLDPIISGNKAYKLIFNLIEARGLGVHRLITCGGAWSNHIHAVAAAGARFGFETVGIIRGERLPRLSPTLQDAERFGMKLVFVSREQYRQRNRPDFVNLLGLETGRDYYIPEGGANKAGAEGVKLLGAAISQSRPANFDEVWLPCGTGLTLGALAAGLAGEMKVVGVPVLKAEHSIEEQARHWQSLWSGKKAPIKIIRGAHCGGYAKYPGYLQQFQGVFEAQTGVALDSIYTTKVAYALHRLCVGGSGGGQIGRRRVLMLHTGGLQGRRGVG